MTVNLWMRERFVKPVVSGLSSVAVRLGLVAAVVCAATAAQAQYKCADGKGAVTYQQMPCPKEHRELPHSIRSQPVAESAPAPSAASPSTASGGAAPARSSGNQTARTAPSGRPCKTAAEYAEIKRELSKPKAKPAPGEDPSMAALANSMFAGVEKKLEEEMKACL